MQYERLDEFAYLLSETLRHLSKHDTLENANLFGYLDDTPSGNAWNNDTIVYALQVICEEWLVRNGFIRHSGVMPYLDYVTLDGGLCPPIERTLREIEILPDHDSTNPWP